MKDKRGTDRGPCKEVSCGCREYQYNGANNPCVQCGHPPAKHQNRQSPNQASSINTSSLFEDVGSHNYGSIQPTTSYCIQPLTTAEMPSYLPYQSPSSSVLPHIKCQRSGCTRPKHKKEDGSGYYDYCGRACADNQRSQADIDNFASASSNTCLLPGCNKPVWHGFQFCGRAHGVQYKQTIGEPPEVDTESMASTRSHVSLSSPAPVLPRESCKNRGCPRRRCSVNGVMEDYCGRNCASRGGSQSPKVWLVDVKSKEYTTVVDKFLKTWMKNSSPAEHDIKAVFFIDAARIHKRFVQYSSGLPSPNTVEVFHGTVLKCNITTSQTLCSNVSCSICGICQNGFQSRTVRQHVPFQRLGSAFYFGFNSSKCYEYSEGVGGFRGMLLCEVAQGNTFKATGDMTNLTGPPSRHDSVSAIPGTHSGMNYPEVAVYREDAVHPKYVIIYQKDGEKLLL